MKNILVLSYCISPLRGSEYSVGWNYVNEMSKNNKLIVLCGAAGEHMGDFDELDGVILNNVRFVKIKPNHLAEFLNKLNKLNIINYAFYFAYNLWHKSAYAEAMKIVESEKIDLIHYVCPIGYREPGWLWKINLPYIWGPIGGIKNRPLKAMGGKNAKDFIMSATKNLVNYVQFNFNRNVESAIKRANLLLTSTSEIGDMVRHRYNVESIVIPENAIHSDLYKNNQLIEVAENEALKILWIGSIDNRKSLEILIYALSKVKNKNWILNVIGEGEKIIYINDLILKFNLTNNVRMLGKIPRLNVFDVIKNSHIHVITSMMEGNPTTLWETMSFGVPTMSLDHCGMRDVICEKCGIKIPVTTFNEIVDRLYFEINKIINNKAIIKNLSIGVNECAKNFIWEVRRKQWNNYYDVAIEDWSRKSLNIASQT